MQWSDVLQQDPIYLNLGGFDDCHPRAGYEHYIVVDANPRAEWSVKHDLRTPLPLPDGSVTRIHTEDFLEHVAVDDIKRILAEAYRLLRPGGTLRIAVPDYGNPKDIAYTTRGRDPRLPLHVTLTTYPLLKEIIQASPFQRYTFYHYWDGDTYTQHPVDYSLGMVKRTPDHDKRCTRQGVRQKFFGALSDFLFKLSRRFRYRDIDLLTRKGHQLYVTSIVVDLYKD